MNFIRFIILIMLAAGTYLLVTGNFADDTIEEGLKKGKDAAGKLAEMLDQEEEDSFPDDTVQKESLSLEGDMYKWIGKDKQSLLDTYGQPQRKDPSAYGYTWWVYNNDPEKYLQFGVEDGKISTWFLTGAEAAADPLTIGDDYQTVKSQHDFKKKVTYKKGIEHYTFILSKDDLTSRPLVQLSDSVFAQLYFDTFTNQLSSIRVMNYEVLLKQQPYQVSYRGKLPKSPVIEKEWKAIEAAREKQIFDITNRYRSRFGKERLEWYQPVAEVAFKHSKDMQENNYFSHYTPEGIGLPERLKADGVTYSSAGENIAAQYPDAAAAMEGWLNSKGHREALLHNRYSHLGVGVYRDYYTQNFLVPR
ncbi:CAP domain-containing protein [Thalassobacillus devorans]|uniref:CAP domain-containing protein n=1 Tax=Thalassobacillus devorans TaxID=279813 RepID=UPI00048EE43E|nr:CAP domain-containing protein [Thalassobacillus devorans]